MRVQVVKDYTPHGGARGYKRGELLDLPDGEARRLIELGAVKKHEPPEPTETKEDPEADEEAE